jgi:hypothetical protein
LMRVKGHLSTRLVDTALGSTDNRLAGRKRISHTNYSSRINK